MRGNEFPKIVSSADWSDRVLDSIGEGIHVLDEGGIVVYENAVAIDLLGNHLGETIAYLFPRGEKNCPIKTPVEQLENDPAHKTLKDGETRRIESATLFRQNGQSFPADYFCAPLLCASQSITGVVINFRDISRRQKTEELQSCRAAVLLDIVASTSLSKVLDRIARCVENAVAGALVSVMTINEEDSKLYVASAPSLPPDYVNSFARGLPIGPDSGSCGTATYRREPVIVSDISSDPLWTDHQELARSFGLRACWSWPVLDSNGKPLATLAVYHREPKPPTSADEEVIVRISATVGIAVEWARREGHLSRLNTCISHLNDIVMITESSPLDEPGPRIVFVNEAFERLTGYTQAEVLGRSPRILQGPKTDRRELARIREGLESQRAVKAEILNYRKDGTEFWVEFEIVPVFNTSDQTSSFVAVQRDVTTRRLNEQALRESEERHHAAASQLAKVLDSSLDVICTIDAEGRFVQVNRACEEVWGYSAATLIGTIYLNYVIEDDVERTVREAHKLFSGTPVHSFENRYRRNNGDIVHMQWSAQWSDAEQLMFGVGRDITEARRDSARIAEQASLLDKAQDAIIVRDLDDRILLWNPSAERLYGWTAEEVMGRRFEEIVCGASSRCRGDRDILLSVGEWVGELEQVRKDGTILSIDARCTLVRGDDGQPKSILTINTDISQRKQLEAQFLRAQRMESVGTLAGGIAHDLNNILAPILMAGELLTQEITEPDQLDMLATIQESAQRGADMVRQVLNYARGLDGERSQVKTADLIGAVHKIVKDTFPKNVVLQVRVEHDLWSVCADMTQLHQVLLNLCVNARDAMPGGGRLRISAENMMIDDHYAGMNLEAQTGPYVKIEVEDNGCGMSQDVLDRIFDPFFTTKKPGQGTGLGLSTTLTILKGHQGFVRVYSEPNNGTCFRVYLPAGDHDQVLGELSKEPPLLPGNGETVLVIDDEEAIRRISKKTLESFGYKVLLASDGPEAVAIYASHPGEVALVLTDMMMPGMDGPSTIQALRRLNPDLRVIAASGIGTSSMVAEATAVGVKHFLAKPFSTRRLLETIHLALEG